MRVEGAPLILPSQKMAVDGSRVKQEIDREISQTGSEITQIGRENPQTTQPLVTETEVIQAVERANKTLQIHGTQLEFSIHDKTKEIMVKVIDQETKEVIREIPPEKILDMVAKLWELAGILVDERR